MKQMKNKKKGFTLVELLAVIVILAILLVIVVPKINSVITEAKKNAFEKEAYGIINAIKISSMDNIALGDSMEEIYDFPNDKLNVQGEQPQGGTIKVDKKGNIEVAIHNGKWCAIKNAEDDEITLIEYKVGECDVGAVPFVSTPIIPQLTDITTTENDIDVGTVIVPSKVIIGAYEVIEFTIYTVGYVSNSNTTSMNYTFNFSSLPFDLENNTLLVTSSGLMMTQEDFDNYVAMKAIGKADNELVNLNPTNSAVATAEELYNYSMTSSELTLNSVDLICTKEYCSATIDESFTNLSKRTFHNTTKQNGENLSALYNGVKFKVTVVKRIAQNDASDPFGLYKYMGMVETTNFKIVHENYLGKLYHTGETEDVVVPSVITGKPYHVTVDLEKCVGDSDDPDAALACAFLMIGIMYGPSSQMNTPENAAAFEALGISYGDGYLKLDQKVNTFGCQNLVKSLGGTEDEAVIFCTQENIDEMFKEVDIYENIDAFLLADAYGLIYLTEYMSYETESYPITTLTEENFTWGGDINSITISDSIISIESDALYNKDIATVDFSNATSLQYIGEDAFRSNNLTSLDLSKATKLKEIGSYAFSNNNLTSVSLPNSLTTIGTYAFRNNSTLTSITIDNTSGAISGSPWGATNATINYLR